MKSPAELRNRLAKQWGNANLRESRLLAAPDAWPVSLPVGKPTATAVASDTRVVREHCDAWRSVREGEIIWKSARYRATLEPVTYPSSWVIPDAETWIRASGDRETADEFHDLSRFLSIADPDFRSLLIRRRSLWLDRDPADVERALHIVPKLSPGSAGGLPLRLLPLIGNDTKFFERNEHLISSLLDIRYDGEASAQGLEAFLGAHSDRGHWLLLIDLDGGLLPLPQIRVRATDLHEHPLRGTHLLIVENESCQHLLPPLPGTIAVLGTGFDLAWTSASWLRERTVAYWGDLDTWGLDLLGRARANHPDLTALLMTREIFDAGRSQTVTEPVAVSSGPHRGLTTIESKLFSDLHALAEGRLEQEFLPLEVVQATLGEWHNGTSLEIVR